MYNLAETSIRNCKLNILYCVYTSRE